MILPSEQILATARKHLEAGDNLPLAHDYFARLLNETINGHGDRAFLIFYLGCVAMKQSYHVLADLLFREAIKDKKDFIEAINNLGYVLKNQGRFEEAHQHFKSVVEFIEKNPDRASDLDKADYYTNVGSLMIASGTPNEALALFNKALALCEDRPQTKWNKALALLELGNYEEGFQYYDHGDRTAKEKERLYGRTELPFWDGTPGKRVIVYGEQGIGDELMFASMLPDVMRDCNIILDAHPRLIEIFRNSFPGLTVYGTRKTTCKDIAWTAIHEFDAKIGIGSLAKFYRRKEEDFPRTPYLQPDPAIKQKYAEKLEAMGDKPKIGISWKGGTAFTGANDRSLPMKALIDIFRMEDVDFISLQYHKDVDAEIAEFEKNHGVHLNHWRDAIDDYDETIGLVANLDLVISVPQSVVHLAGGLGVPVFQMCPFRAMWQMGVHGKDMPWYSTVKNFWQAKDSKWDSVINNVRDELCNLLQTTTKN